MNDKLFDWITDELNKREWSYNELARRAGISSSNVSIMMNGQRTLTPGFCVSVANALEAPVDHVLWLAGFTPRPARDELAADPELARAVRILTRLPPGRRRAAIEMIEGLAGEEGDVAVQEPRTRYRAAGPAAQPAPPGDDVGALRRFLAGVLVSLLSRMHPDDVVAVYDDMKQFTESEQGGLGALADVLAKLNG